VRPPKYRDDPWPLQWESMPAVDLCRHQWETHACPPMPWHYPDRELVARCLICHTPRCGHVNDENPCLERMHHLTVHIYEDGSFAPLGGILQLEDETR
jgi:hypothetical protein